MPLRQVREVMGMPVTIHVADDNPAASEGVDEAFADFVLLDRTFSPFLADSLLSRINRGELAVSESGALVQQALDLCRHYERATRGYFSAWPHGRLEPSGLVKGWAIDRACSILDRRGCRNYFVDAGGDVQTRGSSDTGGVPGGSASDIRSIAARSSESSSRPTWRSRPRAPTRRAPTSSIRTPGSRPRTG